ncbi:glycosyl transferase [Streptomyces nigrescens]|uniref:Glycosyl transferase n=2 Tax=Streptomyces TaxID=1883 RepID=A0ABM7ZY11_STRNI|nr:activator-dependent family glycosyltransferase [Streptomyces nigrescens]MEE4421632.1 activator-dependent family glycosyltransferase [Streptomyces sp. DSM 41528]BDM71253.1 glycosyl transferase [Streptomyces nigrescens]
MKVLFTSLEGSHFQLMVPLAWSLRTAGHEVRVACKPDLVDGITQAGLTAVPIPCPPWQEALGRFHEEAIPLCNQIETTELERGQPAWETLLAYENLVVPALWAPLNHEEMVDGVVDFARAWRPDLVLWETFCMVGPIAAAVVGASHARLVCGPDLALQMRPRAMFTRIGRELPPEHREDPTAEWFDWHLERLGCARRFDETMLTGQWTIDTRPARVREDLGVDSVAMRYVPYNGRSVVPDWLRRPADRPRVCLTLGTSITADYAMFDLDTMLAGLLVSMAELDIEVIAAIAPEQRAQLPDLPENVRTVDFVPLNDLLPTCAAVVHHGGYQTKATAELHGVPQIILTGWEWVSEGMGETYAQQSALVAVPLREFTPETVRTHLVRVLHDRSFRETARRLRKEILAMPTPNDIIATVEERTARYRPSPAAKEER